MRYKKGLIFLEEHSFSRLYNLEPIGIATPYIESLTSYICRVAEVHNVTVGTLIRYEIAPVLEKEYLSSSTKRGGNRFYDGARTLNGMNENAGDTVSALKRLTSNNSLDLLTMLKWNNVIPNRGLLKKHLSWCPLCFEEWRTKQQTVYIPLMWYLTSIGTCIIHNCLLLDGCIYCNKKVPILHRKSRVGYCPNCYKWQGLPKDKFTNNEVDNEDIRIKGDSLIGELLSSNHQSNNPIKDNIAYNLSFILNNVFGSNIADASNVFNIPKTTLLYWLKGVNIPPLPKFLSVSLNLKIPLVELYCTRIKELTNDIDIIADTEKAEADQDRNNKFNFDYANSQLHEILNMTEPVSMSKAADLIGCNKRMLYEHFPDLCKLVSQRFKTYLESKSNARIVTLYDEIDSAFNFLEENDIYPSRRKIEQLLSKPGLLRENEPKLYWKQKQSDSFDDFDSCM